MEDSVKFPKENTGEIHQDICTSKELLKMTLMAQETN